ncbi:uncharacterized protein LOC111695348 [Eurytemora carolleeae]|uniref:uncharacterized protein LOC111695348 n=1 Tax=Eurytemora carolleeae TaxID=1294199 RepID=UPI000C77040C|nr:uncharacterized protein LOC111695348 [Eurytemora carolleeae]|eukprot:XP_023320421.1 uncharacterized protein LOC111695348 [Eurytemora affinis]
MKFILFTFPLLALNNPVFHIDKKQDGTLIFTTDDPALLEFVWFSERSGRNRNQPFLSSQPWKSNNRFETAERIFEGRQDENQVGEAGENFVNIHPLLLPKISSVGLTPSQRVIDVAASTRNTYTQQLIDQTEVSKSRPKVREGTDKFIIRIL